MNRPSFFNGVVVAALLAFFASAVVAALTPFVGLGDVLRLVIPGLAFAYLYYLLRQSAERIGRLTVLTLWCVMTLITWWLAPPLLLYLLVHVGAIWLVRSLYVYSGVLPALLDLGLSALSIAAAAWAAAQSGSVFLATWCFFLVQALYVAIPQTMQNRRQAAVGPVVDNAAFNTAKRQADQALRQLFTQ